METAILHRVIQSGAVCGDFKSLFTIRFRKLSP